MDYRLTVADRFRNSAVSGGTPLITAHNVPKGQVSTALLYAGLRSWSRCYGKRLRSVSLEVAR